jgi:hypothetical protein
MRDSIRSKVSIVFRSIYLPLSILFSVGVFCLSIILSIRFVVSVTLFLFRLSVSGYRPVLSLSLAGS